jgi:hypothetical protein
MTCREVKELIYLYMDSELDARGTLEVQRHLDTCGVCARSLSNMIDQDRALREAARAEVVDSTRLRQIIIEEVKKQPRLPFRVVTSMSSWKRVAAVAAMVVCAIAIVLAVGILSNRVPRVFADAVDDHVDHCTLDVLRDDVKDPEVLKGAAQDFCGLAILPDISKYGFSEPRARQCTLADEVFLHLIYFNSDKQSASVFMSTHSSKDIASSMRLRELSGYTIASINSSGVDVMVLTTLDQRRTGQIAESVASQIRQAIQDPSHGPIGALHRPCQLEAGVAWISQEKRTDETACVNESDWRLSRCHPSTPRGQNLRVPATVLAA